MPRPDQRANKAALDRLTDRLAGENKNGGEKSVPAEIPVDERTRIAIESVKALYAQQTATYQQNLQVIANEALKDGAIDRAYYNFLDIDKMVWCHRERERSV